MRRSENVLSETPHSLGLTSCPALSSSLPPKFTWAYWLICDMEFQTLYLTSLRSEWKSLVSPRSNLVNCNNMSLIGSQILLALIIQAYS